jgi:aryl-phospho-beta-D-glucosidase BglC (GH1 family)
MPTNDVSTLRVSGSKVVDGAGKPVRLRGVGLAGWLNMENWITGFPSHEAGMRASVSHVLGPELGEFFIDRFLEHFFTEDDAAYLASLGINMVRLPFSYKYLESDDAPFEIREEGFRYLDRVIRQCAAHGIYTILDLHTVPGWQHQDWHCDNPTHTAQFWNYRHFQDRVLNLWKVIAARYKNEPWVAGYNPINEPSDPTAEKVGPYYDLLVDTIREIDQDHIIFLDGNRFSLDFHFFGEPRPNVVYTPHDYPAPGYTPGAVYPGHLRNMHIIAPEEGRDSAGRDGDRENSGAEQFGEDGQYWDKDQVEKSFLMRTEYMRDNGLPIVVGEFNAVFRGDPKIDAGLLMMLSDQLDVFRKHDVSWTYWSYKDVGVAAPLGLAADSGWMRRVRPMLEKKARLSVDLWGGQLSNIHHLLNPIREMFDKEFPEYRPYPWGKEFMINRIIPQTLFAQALLPEFGELFRGMNENEIDEMMQSFRLENCVPREDLVTLLRDDAQRG